MSDEHKDYDGIKYRPETGAPKVFKALFTVLVVWGVSFMGYYLFGGWSSEKEYAENKAKQDQVKMAAQKQPPAAAAPAGVQVADAEAGKKIYNERCASCHGADGKGGIGPNLTAASYKYGKDDPALAKSISEGRPGGMPGFANDLSRDKVDGLVKFIRSLK